MQRAALRTQQWQHYSGYALMKTETKYYSWPKAGSSYVCADMTRKTESLNMISSKVLTQAVLYLYKCHNCNIRWHMRSTQVKIFC